MMRKREMFGSVLAAPTKKVRAQNLLACARRAAAETASLVHLFLYSLRRIFCSLSAMV